MSKLMVGLLREEDCAGDPEEGRRPSADNGGHVLLLTGQPGVGKTTLLRRVAAALSKRRLGGFTTEEVRERGQRVGFRIAPHGGRARLMAHVNLEGPPRVGRYGVDIAAVDAVTEEALALDPAVSVYLVDEIGKMECLSPRFVSRMRALLDSDRPLVASVALRGGGFIEEAKARHDVALWEISQRNRDALVQSILAWLEKADENSRTVASRPGSESPGAAPTRGRPRGGAHSGARRQRRRSTPPA